MGLPDLIEIVPVDAPTRAQITVPGSKSITNRALVLAALGPGETILRGALWSEDTEVMVDCLRELGFMLAVQEDPAEPCNRTITVYGKGGEIPPGGTEQAPLELFVGNAGTAARFLSALVCLGRGTYRLHGVERMHQRPQAGLLHALRSLGYRIDTPNERLPATIHGGGHRPGTCRVSIAESSQFASALLLCADTAGWTVEVEGDNPEESPYIGMTLELLKRFKTVQGDFEIEPDASSGSYFLAAGLILPAISPNFDISVSVSHWPSSGWQADEAFGRVVNGHEGLCRGLKQLREQVGYRVVQPPADQTGVVATISRSRDLADSIMTAIVLAPFSTTPVRFTDLGRLRLQECERVQALRTELTKSGAAVVEEGDALTVNPSVLHGGEIETYNDHRMAMCFATLGLKVPGIKLRNASCVKKTFPNFFQKLAALPPDGLGVELLDCRNGHKLAIADLFAD